MKVSTKTATATLEIVAPPEPPLVIDWESLPAFIPECLLFTEAELERDWYLRQSILDENRRPVEPPKEPKIPSPRAAQIEMFRSTYNDIFESDARFEQLVAKPDPKDGSTKGRILLLVDTNNAYEDLAPLLKLQNHFVRVLIGGTSVSVKDLES